jgi:ribonuclease T1
MRSGRQWLAVAAVVLVAGIAWVLGQGAFSGGGGSGPDHLPTVALTALPVQARDTVALIDAGGPFPYTRDGIVFHNYEGLLPDQPDGYYHEYTVPTPGSSDRGARRIITGADHRLYWTDDHYRSFERVTR